MMCVLTPALPDSLPSTCVCPAPQATPNVQMQASVLDALTKRTQDGGTEVVNAKAGKVSCVRACMHACGTILNYARRPHRRLHSPSAALLVLAVSTCMHAGRRCHATHSMSLSNCQNTFPKPTPIPS